MKNSFLKPGIVILAVLIGLAACKSGPEPRAGEAIRRYEGLPGVYSFRIPPAFLGVFLTEDVSADVRTFLASMKTIKIILVNRTEAGKGLLESFTDDFMAVATDEGFEDLMVMNDGPDKVSIKIHEEESMIDEALILITGTDEFLGLSIVGEIDPDILGRVVNEFNADNFNLPIEQENLNSREQ